MKNTDASAGNTEDEALQQLTSLAPLEAKQGSTADWTGLALRASRDFKASDWP